MEYLIPLVLVLILVGGFVTFLVLNATRRGRSATRGGEDGPPGIGRDRTPLGDTSEHAGRQTDSGRTVGGQDSAAGQPAGSGHQGTGVAGQGGGEDRAHVRRSGEGEGTERLEFEGVEPPAAARARRMAAPGAAAAGAGDDPPQARGEGAPAADADADEASPESDPEASPESDPEAAPESDPDEAPPESERLADRGF
jgi:hypothetical protein